MFGSISRNKINGLKLILLKLLFLDIIMLLLWLDITYLYMVELINHQNI